MEAFPPPPPPPPGHPPPGHSPPSVHPQPTHPQSSHPPPAARPDPPQDIPTLALPLIPAARRAPEAPGTPEAPGAAPGDAGQGARRRSRARSRTGVIVGAAALLGVIAGVATGYKVQADREPTRLPPLSQEKLAYPKKPLPEGETEPIPGSHDRRVKTEGDLRKLLVKRPEGTEESDFVPHRDGWQSTATHVQSFDEPGFMFETLTDRDVRRIAVTAWEKGNRLVTVHLVQFRDLKGRSAQNHAEEQQSYMAEDEYAGNGGHAIDGPGEGRYYVYDAPHREAGYLPMYAARAIARHGDIMMNIWVHDTGPVGKKMIADLAEQQLERLS